MIDEGDARSFLEIFSLETGQVNDSSLDIIDGLIVMAICQERISGSPWPVKENIDFKETIPGP